MDRRSRDYKVPLPAQAKPATLDILVEAMGRVNFVEEVHDRKGIHGPVRIVGPDGQAAVPASWQIYSLPLDRPMLDRLHFKEIRLSLDPHFGAAKSK